MGGTITLPSKDQTISDLRKDSEHFERLLKNIINAKNTIDQKRAIEEAKQSLYPRTNLPFTRWNWTIPGYGD